MLMMQDEGTALAALDHSVVKGRYLIVETLLETVHDHYTSIILSNEVVSAAREGHTEVVRLLLEWNFEYSSWDGDSALNMAIGSASVDALDLLLKDGRFDVNEVCQEYGSPLHYAVRLAGKGVRPGQYMVSDAHKHAVRKKRQDILTLLVSDPSVDINKRDFGGNTALHLAAESMYPESVRTLLMHADVDLTLVDRDGLTALHRAMRSPHTSPATQIMHALLADPRCQQNDTSTFGHAAYY